MDIVTLATSLYELDNQIMELEMDLLASPKELKEKEKEKKRVQDELLFYSQFQELYEKSDEYELDKSLLYPFKEGINEKGEKIFLRKSRDEYIENVNLYLQTLEEAFKEGKMDNATYKELKQEASELANKQLEKVEKEEEKEEKEEKEEEIDLDEEHKNILLSIENTKRAYIVSEIGEESYGLLENKYKNMQEVDRKVLLRKTHEGLCREMGIKCNLDYTKYDLDVEQTVNKEGYCIVTKDLNSVPYPLDTILLEQTFKLHIKEILDRREYTNRQKEELIKRLYQDLTRQKELVFINAKRRELEHLG